MPLRLTHWLVKKGVEKVGPQITKTEMKLDKVSISILSGSGALHGFTLGNPEGYKTPSAIKFGEASVGVRPTIADGLKPTCEVHLLDRTVDLYEQRVSVRFCHKLRDEMRYDGLDALREAIAKDVADTRLWFAEHTF